MHDRVISLGIIGGGMMSQIAHLPFFLSDGRCKVVAVAESRPSLVRALSSDRRIGRIVTDHSELLADEAIDAVVICAPRPATASLTLAALRAGKHVLAEKPMALTFSDACQLVEAAETARVIYAIGFMKRYDPGVQTARQIFFALLESGRLGKLLLARFYDFSKSYAVRPPTHVRPGESRTLRFAESALWPEWLPECWREMYSWFVNAGSHDLNLINYFFQDGVTVEGATASAQGSVVALCRSADVQIILEVSRSDLGLWQEGIEFIFAYGRLAVQLPSPMAVDKVASVVLEENQGSFSRHDISAGSGWCFEHQARGFIDALAGICAPATTGRSGLADMLLNDGIWRAIVGQK